MIKSQFISEENQTKFEKLIIASFNQVIVNIESDEDKLNELDKKFNNICEKDIYYSYRLRKKIENIIIESIYMHLTILIKSVEDYHNTVEYVSKMNESDSIKILNFFRQELPDVYSKLKREFNKRRGI